MPESGPLVTVLLAVFNGERYLKEALDSVAAQTLDELELLVIDDASTDRSSEILRSYADRRLRVLRHERNLGLAASLNRGLDLARGRYVARLDADDVCEPQRLAKQVQHMEAHPGTGIVGTYCMAIGEHGELYGTWPRPCSDLAIRWTSLLSTPFVHSSVMLRRTVLETHGLRYDPAFHVTQDRDLWLRLLRVTQGTNLPEPLVRYRIHQRQASTTRRRDQNAFGVLLARRILSEEFPQVHMTDEEISGVHNLFYRWEEQDPEALAKVVPLTRRYVDLFSLFAARHARHPDLPALRGEVAMLVIRRARTHLIGPEFLKALELIVWAIAENPLAPVRLAPRFARRAAWLAKQSLARRWQ